MRPLLLALIALSAAHAAPILTPDAHTHHDELDAMPELELHARMLQEALESSEFDVHANARELQEASKPASYSIWGVASRFFATREKMKAKTTGATIPTGTKMPKEIGIGYKQMLDWHCAKTENAGKSLCIRAKAVAGSPTALMTKPSMGDSVLAVKGYCAEASNAQKPLCTWSKLSKKAAPSAPKAPVSQSVAAAAAVPAATVAAKPVKAKASGVKKVAKAAKKAAKVGVAAQA